MCNLLPMFQNVYMTQLKKCKYTFYPVKTLTKFTNELQTEDTKIYEYEIWECKNEKF